MPLVVNKEEIKLEIMQAFQYLSNTKPLTAISLREIAAQAGISHSKILRYFNDKNSLLVACVHWASSFVYDNIARWFEQHHLEEYTNRNTYLDAFFVYFQTEKQEEVSPRNVVMVCALSAYSEEIRVAAREEFARINELFCTCLSSEFGYELSKEEANTISVIFFGIYFSKFNETISEKEICKPINDIEKIIE